MNRPASVQVWLVRLRARDRLTPAASSQHPSPGGHGPDQIPILPVWTGDPHFFQSSIKGK